MKLFTLCVVAASAAFTMTLPAQAQQTMRCKNDLAQVGDGKAAVLQKCGEPVARDSFCKPVEQQRAPAAPNVPPASVTVNVLACEQVDEWTYNPGRGQFMTTLRFESGTLRSLKYGDRVN